MFFFFFPSEYNPFFERYPCIATIISTEIYMFKSNFLLKYIFKSNKLFGEIAKLCMPAHNFKQIVAIFFRLMCDMAILIGCIIKK